MQQKVIKQWFAMKLSQIMVLSLQVTQNKKCSFWNILLLLVAMVIFDVTC